MSHPIIAAGSLHLTCMTSGVQCSRANKGGGGDMCDTALNLPPIKLGKNLWGRLYTTFSYV